MSRQVETTDMGTGSVDADVIELVARLEGVVASQRAQHLPDDAGDSRPALLIMAVALLAYLAGFSVAIVAWALVGPILAVFFAVAFVACALLAKRDAVAIPALRMFIGVCVAVVFATLS